MPNSPRPKFQTGIPASGWDLYDAVNRELPVEDLVDIPKPRPAPEESVLQQSMDYARQVSRDLLKAQQTIRQLRQENEALHYLLGDRIA